MTLVSLEALAPGDLAFCEVPAVAHLQDGLAPTLEDLQAWADLFGALGEQARRRVLDLCCHPRPTEGSALEELLGDGACLPQRLRLPEGVSPEELWRFLRILESNAFQTPAGDGRFRIELLPVCARLNHSCLPNVLHGPGVIDGTVEVRALRHVAAGEELTISYIDEATLLAPTSVRRGVLRHWQFECGCQRCGGGDFTRSFRCFAADCLGAHFMATDGLGSCDHCGRRPSAMESLRISLEEETLREAVCAAADAALGMELSAAAALEVIDRCERATTACSQVSPLHNLITSVAKAVQGARGSVGDDLARRGFQAAAEVCWRQAAAELRHAIVAEFAVLPVPCDGRDDDLVRLAALYARLGWREEQQVCLSKALAVMGATHWAATPDVRADCASRRGEVEATLAAA